MSAALTQPAPARPFLAVSRRWFSHTGTDCRTQTQLLLCSSSPSDSPGPAPGSRRTVTAPSPPPGPLLRLSTDTGPGGPGPLRADGKGRPGGRGGAVVPVGATRGPTSGATEAAPARDGPRGSSPAPTLRGCGRSSQTPLRPGRTARRLGPKAADRTGRGPSSLADPAPPPARSRRRRLTSLFRTMPRARRRPMPLSAPSSSATPARLISSFPPPGPGPGPGPDIPALAAAEQARLDCAAAAPPAPPMRAPEAVRLHGNGRLLRTARARRPSRPRRPRLRPRPGAPPAPRCRRVAGAEGSAPRRCPAEAVPEDPPRAPPLSAARTGRKPRPSPRLCRKFRPQPRPSPRLYRKLCRSAPFVQAGQEAQSRAGPTSRRPRLGELQEVEEGAGQVLWAAVSARVSPCQRRAPHAPSSTSHPKPGSSLTLPAPHPSALPCGICVPPTLKRRPQLPQAHTPACSTPPSPVPTAHGGLTAPSRPPIPSPVCLLCTCCFPGHRTAGCVHQGPSKTHLVDAPEAQLGHCVHEGSEVFKAAGNLSHHQGTTAGTARR